MIIPGLVSITFRKLSPSEIIEIVAQAGLKVIEWGGDIHVPHGDIKQAETVARWTVDAGLSVAAYGSYYRLATPDQPTFESIVETAVALDVPTIRIWAGNRGSIEADDAYRQKVYEEAYQVAEMAQQSNISISLEFHDGTLADTQQSALQLINTVQHDNLKMYWQPPHRVPHEECIASLESFLPHLTNVHVFQWHRDHPIPRIRYALSEGKTEWQVYLKHLKDSDQDHAAMLEFVKDDDPDCFREDASTLLSWIK